jgi:hypothetical protein
MTIIKKNMDNFFKTLAVSVLLCSEIVFPQSTFVPIIEWDFRNGLQDWMNYHEITEPVATAEGITFELLDLVWSFNPLRIGGSIQGPAVDFQKDQIIRVVIRMKSTAGDFGNLYYHIEEFAEHQGKTFSLQNDGQLHDSHFMMVPSDIEGAVITLQSIIVESMPMVYVDFEKPAVPGGTNPQVVSSGALKISHYGEGLGTFR